MKRSNVIPIDRDWINLEREAAPKRSIQKFVPVTDIDLRDCPRFMTVAYVARLLEVDIGMVYEWIKQRRLRAHNLSSGKRPSYRIFRDHLAAFLIQQAG